MRARIRLVHGTLGVVILYEQKLQRGPWLRKDHVAIIDDDHSEAMRLMQDRHPGTIGPSQPETVNVEATANASI